MPKPTGVLHNCWKITLKGRLIGYVTNELIAETIVERLKELMSKEYEHHIEPWFIEGEF